MSSVLDVLRQLERDRAVASSSPVLPTDGAASSSPPISPSDRGPAATSPVSTAETTREPRRAGAVAGGIAAVVVTCAVAAYAWRTPAPPAPATVDAPAREPMAAFDADLLPEVPARPAAARDAAVQPASVAPEPRAQAPRSDVGAPRPGKLTADDGGRPAKQMADGDERAVSAKQMADGEERAVAAKRMADGDGRATVATAAARPARKAGSGSGVRLESLRYGPAPGDRSAVVVVGGTRHLFREGESHGDVAVQLILSDRVYVAQGGNVFALDAPR